MANYLDEEGAKLIVDKLKEKIDNNTLVIDLGQLYKDSLLNTKASVTDSNNTIYVNIDSEKIQNWIDAILKFQNNEIKLSIIIKYIDSSFGCVFNVGEYIYINNGLNLFWNDIPSSKILQITGIKQNLNTYKITIKEQITSINTDQFTIDNGKLNLSSTVTGGNTVNVATSDQLGQIKLGSGLQLSGDFSNTLSGPIYPVQLNSNNQAGVQIPDIPDYWKAGTTSNSIMTKFAKESSGLYSVAEGFNTTASGNFSHAEGRDTTASKSYSHAEGLNTTASGDTAHAEGNQSTASGYSAHAEGNSTSATAQTSHAEGNGTVASEFASHAEGDTTFANGYASHSAGYNTVATGRASYAGGTYSNTKGQDSFAHGDHVNTLNPHETAFGRANKSTRGSSDESKENTLFSIGNGSTGNSDYTQNAFEVKINGAIYIPNINSNSGRWTRYEMMCLQDKIIELENRLKALEK